MSEHQKFTTSLKQPWALVRVQGSGQPGRRPPTSVAWFEYPKKNEAGEIVGYYGCELSPSRRYRGGWVFGYKNQKVISLDRVLHTFPIVFSKTAVAYSGIVNYGGPSAKMVNAAKLALPVITESTEIVPPSA